MAPAELRALSVNPGTSIPGRLFRCTQAGNVNPERGDSDYCHLNQGLLECEIPGSLRTLGEEPGLGLLCMLGLEGQVPILYWEKWGAPSQHQGSK